MCTDTLVCDEERSLTFAHWRSAAVSERARLSAVLMSWGEAAAKGEIQAGSVPSKTHSSNRPLF